MDELYKELLELYKQERARNDELVKIILQHAGMLESDKKVLIPQREEQTIISHGRKNWAQVKANLERITAKPKQEWANRADEASKELESDASQVS